MEEYETYVSAGSPCMATNETEQLKNVYISSLDKTHPQVKGVV